MPLTMADIRRAAMARYHRPITVPVFGPLPAPVNVAVSSTTGGFVITWAQVDGAEGYKVAVMTNQNRTLPDRGIHTVMGGASNRFVYPVPSVTRYFSVVAFRGGVDGEYSGLVSGTSSAGAFGDTATQTSPNPATTAAPNEGLYDYGWSDPSIKNPWD